jgi:citronellol/citronellal dehydrogenase
VNELFRAGLFKNKVVLITGGGSGIGRCAGGLFARLGASVAICGRRPEPLAAACAEFQSHGVRAFAAPCDVRQAEQVADFVEAVVGEFGRLDVLVNNAGGQFPSAAENISPKGFEAVVRNNLLGTWNVTHAVANRAFIPGGGGCIVNVSAQVARGFPGMAHTGAARAGVENLTKTLAVEWCRHGIRVNAVAPGIVRSSGTERYPADVLELGRRATPMRRLGRPEEVASLILYLSSEAADFITGQTVFIDGGQSLWGDLWDIPDPQASPA